MTQHFIYNEAIKSKDLYSKKLSFLTKMLSIRLCDLRFSTKDLSFKPSKQFYFELSDIFKIQSHIC